MLMLPRRSALAAALVGLSWLGLPPGVVRAAEVSEGVLGDPNAPVTLIEYSSLTCPHCAAFQRDTFPALKQRYIDTGKVKMVLRDFPLDEVALKAAVIAHCAGADKYPRFVDVFFLQQASWTRAQDPIAALKQLAKLGGLGEDAAEACLADEAMEKAVLQSRLDAQQRYNVRSTPTFILGDKTFSGSRSIDEFAAMIDPLLKQ
ncbi:DsbA family protein [Benzoatithermus flavus]|uniref:DsbA family protein n=1 Tax=Benzoatithermus flavus TaxID=3108223 RepID=A0ABU8XMA4_9PROT